MFNDGNTIDSIWGPHFPAIAMLDSRSVCIFYIAEIFENNSTKTTQILTSKITHARNVLPSLKLTVRT